MNWLKRCLANPKSIWYFIPNHIFDKIGSLSFILKCNYLPSKLPMALSKFHQQCLLAWKLCYVHSFSPHRTCLCLLPSEINHYFSPGGFKILLTVSFAYLMTQEIFSLMSNL